jgi:hypothetical protein
VSCFLVWCVMLTHILVNIVEGGVKHHKPKTLISAAVLVLLVEILVARSLILYLFYIRVRNTTCYKIPFFLLGWGVTTRDFCQRINMLGFFLITMCECLSTLIKQIITNGRHRPKYTIHFHIAEMHVVFLTRM